MVGTPSGKPIKSLPPERAFVLQLEADTDLSAEELGGRVEHVVSGHATRFESLTQLLAFLRRVVGTTADEETPYRTQPSPAAPSDKEGKDQ